MTCSWCLSDALDLLTEWGFSERQASALLASHDTVFIVPLDGAS